MSAATSLSSFVPGAARGRCSRYFESGVVSAFHTQGEAGSACRFATKPVSTESAFSRSGSGPACTR